MTFKKPGRPSSGEDRETLVHVGFKADQRTLNSIKKLTSSVVETVGSLRVGVQSAAIRQAINEAAERPEAEDVHQLRQRLAEVEAALQEAKKTIARYASAKRSVKRSRKR